MPDLRSVRQWAASAGLGADQFYVVLSIRRDVGAAVLSFLRRFHSKDRPGTLVSSDDGVFRRFGGAFAAMTTQLDDVVRTQGGEGAGYVCSVYEEQLAVQAEAADGALNGSVDSDDAVYTLVDYLNLGSTLTGQLRRGFQSQHAEAENQPAFDLRMEDAKAMLADAGVGGDERVEKAAGQLCEMAAYFRNEKHRAVTRDEAREVARRFATLMDAAAAYDRRFCSRH